MEVESKNSPKNRPDFTKMWPPIKQMWFFCNFLTTKAVKGIMI